MSSSSHIDNKKKDILVLGKEPTQGLEHTLTAEKMYSINFTATRNKFCLSPHYNTNEPVFYPFSIKTSKCSGSCNNINDSYAKICVPDVVKDLNVKTFNLMFRTNGTRHIKWHETCK